MARHFAYDEEAGCRSLERANLVEHRIELAWESAEFRTIYAIGATLNAIDNAIKLAGGLAAPAAVAKPKLPDCGTSSKFEHRRFAKKFTKVMMAISAPG